jgi:hypothetical protein
MPLGIEAAMDFYSRVRGRRERGKEGRGEEG